MEKKKKENIFRKLLRWTVRGLMGQKYEEKWFGKKERVQKEIVYKNGVPDDSELIVSPGRQIFNRFMERKFAVISVVVVLIMFAVVFMACGGCIGIVVGNLLGANKMEEARDANTKMTAFSVACGFLVALLSMLSAPLFPNLYNTTAEVRTLATAFILISAAFEPFHAYSHACYFTLRSGGKVFLTFLYDAVFVWAINVPVAFVLAEFTSLPITVIYLCSVSTQIIKCILGYAYVRSGRWMNHIV